MTISVLMSVYKAEKPEYLDRALQSVWTDQTLKPNKIVLVEDGELTQELYQIIDKWKSELKDFLFVLQNDINLGLTKSLNKGIKYIETDLIARMDSDDISAQKRFELQVKYLEEHKDISVVGGKIQEFNETSESLAIRNFPTEPNEMKKYIKKASPLAHPTVMMRREIFNTLQYNDKYRTSQDIALWFDVLCRGYKISNVDGVTLYFRRSADMLNRRNKSKAINEFKIYMNGIRRLYGTLNLAYIYPIMRLCFRLMPQSLIKFIYNSKLRTGMLNSF